VRRVGGGAVGGGRAVGGALVGGRVDDPSIRPVGRAGCPTTLRPCYPSAGGPSVMVPQHTASQRSQRDRSDARPRRSRRTQRHLLGMRPVSEVTVASFNTHWGVDRRGRRFDVVDVCKRLDADVLALQEVWRPNGGTGFVDDVAAALGATLLELVLTPDTFRARPKHLPIPPGPPGTWGLAVLSRLPVRERFDVDLGHALGDPVPRRVALCAEVGVDGRPLVFAAVHASHRLYGSPPQLRRLARVLDERRTPNVIAGDCNMWGAVLAPLLRDRRRAVRGATWPAGMPHSQIDHLWVSDGLAVVDGEVLGRTGSDHRPVRARLRLTD